MRFGTRALTVLLLAAAGAAWGLSGTADRVVLRFPAPCADYRAVCTVTGKLDGPPAKVVIERRAGKAWKKVRTLEVNTRTTAMGLRAVRMDGGRGRDVCGLLIECCGGSASHIYLFEVTPKPPAAKQIFYGLDKGSVSVFRDKRGRLTGLTFHYCRWHVDATLGQHVFTAVDYVWRPEWRRFQQMPIRVDWKAEEKASLLDVLSWGGAYLPVEYDYDNRARIGTYIYRPVGILRDKTPAYLRGAKKIKAVVGIVRKKSGRGCDEEPAILYLLPLPK